MNTKSEIIKKIAEKKLIAIVRRVPKEKLIALSEALYEGGIRLVEVTFDAEKKVSDAETAEMIKLLSSQFKDKMLIGAGTVLTQEQVKLTHDAGGCFIISPNVDAAVIKETCDLGMVSIPGALTPTEVVNAHEAGADFVKLFPVTAMGPSYIKAITAPLSHIRLLAVGGVDLSNIGDYLKSGVGGFGLGSNIIDKKLLEKDDYKGIAELAKNYVSAVGK